MFTFLLISRGFNYTRLFTASLYAENSCGNKRHGPNHIQEQVSFPPWFDRSCWGASVWYDSQNQIMCIAKKKCAVIIYYIRNHLWVSIENWVVCSIRRRNFAFNLVNSFHVVQSKRCPVQMYTAVLFNFIDSTHVSTHPICQRRWSTSVNTYYTSQTCQHVCINDTQV